MDADSDFTGIPPVPSVSPFKGPNLERFTAEHLQQFTEADLAHPLAERRVPVLRHPHARWPYHVALVVTGPSTPSPAPATPPATPLADPFAGTGAEPSPREADQLVAYLEWRLRYHRPAHLERLRTQHPFDIDSRANRYVFRNNPEHGWQYNAMSWRGIAWSPDPRAGAARSESLEQLLDRINTTGSHGPSKKWRTFKTERPDLWDPGTT